MPDADLVSTEPAYLEHMLKWVEAGGRIVVAPVFAPNPLRRPKKKENAVTLLDVLGVKGVAVEQEDPYEGKDDDDVGP